MNEDEKKEIVAASAVLPIDVDLAAAGRVPVTNVIDTTAATSPKSVSSRQGFTILQHKQKSDIDRMLLEGDSVEKVARWLKLQNPNTPKNWVSKMTLHHYRTNYLNVKGDVLAEIQAAKREQQEKQVVVRKQDAVKATAEYQEAKGRVVSEILDTSSTIIFIHDKIKDRIELIEQMEVKARNDEVICSYLGQLRGLLNDYHVIMKNLEKGGQTDIQVTIGEAQHQVEAMKEAIRETLTEIAPELVPIFLQKLTAKLKEPGITSIAQQQTVSINIKH